ncbi:unnamed protein product [Prorocentrum cordatum]|uniref:Uncharacterized protein n=1 Tax=Prorocentrum cordatum TaxID=2364126 RepID=A0ABN9Q300_9DINO|nr:unnamed protein product [Polarella glacialis]
MDTLDGETQTLCIAQPLALISHAYQISNQFASFLSRLHAENPSSVERPWRVCLYSDEVTPANPLAVDQKKKVQVMYFSLLEFGAAALCREDLWFLVAQKRSRDVMKVKGGMAQMFGVVLKQLFLEPAGNLTTGIVLRRPGSEPIRLFAVQGPFVQDGGAHKSTWHCKGEGGTKHCLLCKNLFAEKSEIHDEDGSELVTCNAMKHSDLALATSAELRYACNRLAAKRHVDDPNTFARRQMALGFTFTLYNLLCDPTLNNVVQPREQLMFDWMHCLFVGGVWAVCVNLVLESIRAAGMTKIYDSLYGYAKL